VSPDAGDHGTITPSNPQTIPCLASVSLTVVPETGYHILSVTGCGGTLTGGTYTTGPVTEDCTVSATFAVNMYDITAEVTSGEGSISCSPGKVAYGGAFTCNLAPVPGYFLKGLSDNSSEVSSLVIGDSYDVTDVTGPHHLSAAFHENLSVRRISGALSLQYASLQEACATASGGDRILVQALLLRESPECNSGGQILIRGGYDPTFSSVTGFTALEGNLTIGQGSVIIEGLVLQ
jgi:hypothetical protein